MRPQTVFVAVEGEWVRQYQVWERAAHANFPFKEGQYTSFPGRVLSDHHRRSRPPVHPLAHGAGHLDDALAALPVVPADVHGQRVRVLELLVAVRADLSLAHVLLAQIPADI